MKKIRELLILLLAISLTLCATAVVASAEGAAVTDAEIESLIQLYSGGVYYADDFEPEYAISGDCELVDDSGVITGVVSRFGSNMLKLVGAPEGNGDVSIAATLGAETDGFVFKADISADGGLFNIYANGSNRFGENLGNLLIASLDFTNGILYVQEFGDYGMPVMKAVGGVILESSALYSVTVKQVTEDTQYTVRIEKIADADGVALDTPELICDYTGVSAVENLLGAKMAILGEAIKDKTLYLDNVYFYEGAEEIDLASEEAKIGAAISKLVESMAGASSQQMIGIIEKLNLFIIVRAFTSPDYVDEIKYANLKIAEHYVTEYVNKVALYNAGDIYTEKVALLREMELTHGKIPEIPTYSEDEDAEAYALSEQIKSVLLNAEAEYESINIKLNELSRQSRAFIEYMSDKDIRNNTYSVIKTWVDEASRFAYDPTFYVNEIVDGRRVIVDITDYLADYVHLCNKVSVMRIESLRYIDAVAVMADESKSFSERYGAYVEASGIYMLDLAYTFVDEEKGSLADAVLLYQEKSSGIIETERVCTNFLSAISEAASATDIAGLNASLLKAELYDMSGEDGTKIPLELTYPGVTEAIASYEALCQRRVTEAAKAAAFVEAVEAIRLATDYASLSAAINRAGDILPEGILNGYEGYNEALTYFLTVESDLICNATYVERFLSAVASLNSMKAGKEKYDTIKAAFEYYGKIIDADSSVLSAKAVLDATVIAYDKEIEAANGDFAESVGESSKIASAAAPTDAYLRVVAVVKKIFE